MSPFFDRRLLAYASSSWNAHQAAYGLQQFVSLMPSYADSLELMYGRNGIGDARRAWGVIADLASAMTGLPATMDSLLELGFLNALDVDRIIDFGGDFQLSGSPVLGRLDFSEAINGDLTSLLEHAVAHDRVAKPLLESFQDELRAYDYEMTSYSLSEGDEVRTFRRMLRELEDEPDDFPLWQGRPLFLEEQRAVLDYLGKSIGAEIIADNLVDEALGEFLLRTAGVLHNSSVTRGPVLDIDRVPHNILPRPVHLVCHQVGNATLNALAAFDPDAQPLDRLFVVEAAVKAELGIDVSPALDGTRELVTERYMSSFSGIVIDITDKKANAKPFDFPELSAG